MEVMEETRWETDTTKDMEVEDHKEVDIMELLVLE
jgi:hypothetical protein